MEKNPNMNLYGTEKKTKCGEKKNRHILMQIEYEFITF